jgi:hypothetical protein
LQSNNTFLQTSDFVSHRWDGLSNNANAFEHWFFRNNGTDTELFKDGNNLGLASSTPELDAGLIINIFCNGWNTNLGANGTLDEIKIFNGTLVSELEINQTRDNLHKNPGNLTTELRDSGSGNENKNVTLTLSDYNQSKANVSIYIDKNDGVFALIQTNASNNTAYSIDSGDANQTYNVRLVIITNDASYTPVIQKIVVGEGVADTTPPTLSVVSPVNGSTISDSTPLFNATFGELVNATWITVDVGAAQNLSPGTGNLTLNLSLLGDGLHNITVYANDSTGNINSSTVYFTIDTGAPTITVVSPPNATTTDTTPMLNATFGETVDTAWYSLDGGVNLSYSASTQNLTLNLAVLSVGQHNVTVYANDSFGNLNSSNVFFTVITVPPVKGSSTSDNKVLSSADVLVVANSIDSALVEEFLSELKISGINSKLMNASDFTMNMRTSNRLIIILGGPDAPEGVGELVGNILSQEEQQTIRGDQQALFIKKNVYTDRFSYSQKVIIIAGSNRDRTKKAGLENTVDVRQTVLD